MSESTNYHSTVHSFYLAFFGRPADPAGLKFWSEHLGSVNGDLGVIAASFANSEEAKTRFGDDTPAERIVQIYEQLFNRGPEPAGLVFWTNAVAQGHVSLAEVAISILEGAQGTDADLALLREQAVADFTARVEASGSDYDGYAAIEAARVLVRAVTPGASTDDIAKAVQAAVAFTDIASTNPAVVDAIATGSTLLGLFDTQRGLADPVTLVQALADVAEAAAGNPATLESLLRGGGMAKVLEVMPARASLQDVVDALAEGGLPAAIDVVYPPRPTTPPPAAGVKFTFEGVTHDAYDRAPDDNVTSERVVDVEFSFTGALKSGEKFQYSVDGGEHWHDITPVGKRLTIPEINLADGDLVDGGGDKRMALLSIDGDYVTTVQVRVANASNGTVTSTQEKITWDQTPPDGYLEFVRIEGGQDGDQATGDNVADVTFSVDYLDGYVQWRFKGDDKWVDVGKVDNSGNFTLRDIDLAEDDQTIELRVIDAAGNVGHDGEWIIDGPAGARLDVMPFLHGLQIESPVDGKAKLGGVVVDTDHPSMDVVAGEELLLGEQGQLTVGTLTVTPAAGGNELADESGLTYTLGTAAGEEITGNYVWGFGGNDTIDGTAGDDFLMGGDGNDTIVSNGGEDRIAGGAGADTIDIGGPDNVMLGYLGNDTLVGEFKDNTPHAHLDLITGAKEGDSIHLVDGFGEDTPTISYDYLTSDAMGQVALVRGLIGPNNFVASSDGNDYMVQWTDENGINSIMLQGFGGGDLDLKVNRSERSVTLVTKPVVAQFDYIEYAFGVESSAFSLIGSVADVVRADTPNGLLDDSGFSLRDMVTGSLVTGDYTGLGFRVNNDGTLQLAGPLKAGAYEIEWTEGTFATSTGVFGAGGEKFAGGAAVNIVQDGFWYKTEVDLDGQTYDGTDEGARYMFVAGNQPTKLITNDYNDAVLATDGTVHLAYLGFSTQGQDLIIGFGPDDTVTFEGMAAFDVDKNMSGDIDWLSGSGQLAPTSATEAVHFVTDGPIVSSQLDSDLTPTIHTLRSHINVSALAQDDQLLILAHNADSTGAALFHFINLDGDDEINHGELQLIGIFTNGAPEMSQILAGPIV